MIVHGNSYFLIFDRETGIMYRWLKRTQQFIWKMECDAECGELSEDFHTCLCVKASIKLYQGTADIV
jgi:hypothetical protein